MLSSHFLVVSRSTEFFPIGSPNADVRKLLDSLDSKNYTSVGFARANDLDGRIQIINRAFVSVSRHLGNHTLDHQVDSQVDSVRPSFVLVLPPRNHPLRQVSKARTGRPSPIF